ncbi:hypothetical protein ACTFBT_38415 [Streptomyces microflavus]|uniref:Uncharacterized protein n=1 Tax=Streptomyces microflavus TaxID=1919 RepID=A0A7J0D4T3_STRMI|nr:MULTISPECIES: hypothetical protein [Streptomyces]MDX2981653.1 hypothetical protein [Streptomyces sp. NRRL_B-2249]GFN09726.1 hypothetical protein Smic_82820 [Streptomyces microflavus]GGX94970.1 hypothetical protein GCM10010298_70580 [Streptomyces microflavus]
MTTTTRAEKIEYLRDISTRIQQMTTGAERFVYFAGLIAAATVKIGVIDNNALVIIVAPYALAFVITYQIQMYTDVEYLQGVREKVEISVNPTHQEVILMERLVITRKYRNRLSVNLTQTFYGLGMVAFIVYSGVRSHAHSWAGVNLLFFNILGLLACLTLLGAAIYELRRAGVTVNARITSTMSSSRPECDGSSI